LFHVRDTTPRPESSTTVGLPVPSHQSMSLWPSTSKVWEMSPDKEGEGVGEGAGGGTVGDRVTFAVGCGGGTGEVSQATSSTARSRAARAASLGKKWVPPVGVPGSFN
jgi:hypothetical protein